MYYYVYTGGFALTRSENFLVVPWNTSNGTQYLWIFWILNSLVVLPDSFADIANANDVMIFSKSCILDHDDDRDHNLT